MKRLLLAALITVISSISALSGGEFFIVFMILMAVVAVIALWASRYRSRHPRQSSGAGLETLYPIVDKAPFPCCILQEGKVLYKNKEINAMLQGGKLDLEKLCEAQQVNLQDGGVYRLWRWPYNPETDILFLMEVKDGEETCLGATVMGLIVIDNYDDVIDTVDEAMKPLLLAVTNRRIHNFVQGTGGVVRSYEKDKYLFILSEDSLAALKSRKFDILGQIREIEVGNKIPFTLSIGFGINGKDLSQSMDFARAALDMALSRGGDQAVLKDGENYVFFGGKSKDRESHTRVRARVKASVFEELIQESDNVIIMGHRNADLDCLGSAVGVHAIVSTHNKECNIILNSVTTSIKGLYDKITADAQFPDALFISSAQAFKKVKQNTLLVIVDCHRPSIMECPELCDHADKIVVFDHHRKGAEFVQNTVLTYHEPYASSTSELITEMMQYVKNNVALSPLTADALLGGITVDTKNFLIKTGTKTFESAAYLKRFGADTIRVRTLLQNDMESYKAKAMAVNNTEIYGGSIAIAVVPPYVENPTLTTAQVADDLLNISGIEASFSLCLDHAAEQVLISARSLGETNVHYIMEKMGGGGHQTSAGAQVAGEDVDEVILQLKAVIDEYKSDEETNAK